MKKIWIPVIGLWYVGNVPGYVEYIFIKKVTVWFVLYQLFMVLLLLIITRYLC